MHFVKDLALFTCVLVLVGLFNVGDSFIASLISDLNFLHSVHFTVIALHQWDLAKLSMTDFSDHIFIVSLLLSWVFGFFFIEIFDLLKMHKPVVNYIRNRSVLDFGRHLNQKIALNFLEELLFQIGFLSLFLKEVKNAMDCVRIYIFVYVEYFNSKLEFFWLIFFLL